MQNKPVHPCHCPECERPDANPVKALHTQMNFFLSTLDERQRRPRRAEPGPVVARRTPTRRTECADSRPRRGTRTR